MADRVWRETDMPPIVERKDKLVFLKSFVPSNQWGKAFCDLYTSGVSNASCKKFNNGCPQQGQAGGERLSQMKNSLAPMELLLTVFDEGGVEIACLIPYDSWCNRG